MHDLPSIALLQQSHAIPKSGEELEVLGKAASKKYISGACSTLNEAVVDTVKHAGLSPEQVRRVVEFANVNAYLTEFGKEGAAHRYVEFQGGPASPSEVLHDLNDGGGGSVFDRGSSDYSYDPEPPKVASLLDKNRALLKTAAIRLGVASMNDVFGDMAADANRRYQMPPYAGFDPFGDGQRRAQVRMLSAMTGRQPVVHKYAELPLTPDLEQPQPSLSDETRAMIGSTGGELASAGPGVGDPNAPPGVQLGYDPLPEHMKLMQQHMKLMQNRAGGAAAPAPQPAGDPMAPKMAAALDFDPAETAFEQAFAVEERPYPFADPLQDSYELYDKLAGAASHMTSELSALENAFHDTLDSLYHEVKVAALDGVPLGQMLVAWQQVVPSAEYVKTAFLHIGPRLQEEGVFDSLDAVGASLAKTACVGMVNTKHPLVSSMADYCMVLSKLAEVRAAREELLQERNRLDFFIKRAGALIPKAVRAVQAGANRAGDVLGGAAERVARLGFTDDPAVAAAAGKAVNLTTRAVPGATALGVGAYLGKDVHDRVKYNPTLNQLGQGIQSHFMVGSLPYQQREAYLMQRGGF